MFYLFAISPSQCAPKSSSERSTNTFSVAPPAHNLLIALLASHTIKFCFDLNRQLHFCQSSYFIFLNLKMSECFILMFHSFAIFPSPCAPLGSAEQPWTATQKGRLRYLDVQNQSKLPFVWRHTFMFVPIFPTKSTLPSSGSTHQ